MFYLGSLLIYCFLHGGSVLGLALVHCCFLKKYSPKVGNIFLRNRFFKGLCLYTHFHSLDKFTTSQPLGHESCLDTPQRYLLSPYFVWIWELALTLWEDWSYSSSWLVYISTFGFREPVAGLLPSFRQVS